MADGREIPRPPTLAGSPLAKAERKATVRLMIVVVALVVVVAAAVALLGGDDESENPSPALSPQECAELQYDFETAASHSETAAPGSAGSDQALSRMDALDRQMQDGGCY